MSIQPHSFFSGALYARKSCFVYVPAGYEQSEQRYPVIYLLHGMHGSESSWMLKGNAEQTLDQLMNNGELIPSIVVMPSDGGYGQGTFYMDWYDGTGNFEQYFIYDLVPEIDRHYRTIDSSVQRVLCGLSMGGFGAVSLALRHPERFGAAASLSGGLVSSQHLKDQFARSDVGRMIGPLHGPYAESYDPQLVANLRMQDGRCPALYMNCGTSDYLYTMNQDFHQHLKTIGYTHTYEQFEGEHNWTYWKEHLPDALRFIQSYLAH
ncbi:alpha/beta hydrolase [Paenibacillus periandrae]|uniref:alpha/beta hydrolase n=1 Tax=Paenibacillus periandrae TaxID=1761741 RepID=UPI001F08E5FC|nr:alpha/beta hydrolase family protein [Paenibacillus periandrae]